MRSRHPILVTTVSRAPLPGDLRLTVARSFLVALTLVATAGCRPTATTDIAGRAPVDGTALPTPSSVSFPAVAAILDGTELTSMTNVPSRSVAPLEPGRFHAEQGGADLGVTLQRSGPLWDLVRHYVEPGAPRHTVSHRCSATIEGLVSADHTLFLRPTADGILILELNSGCEPIPPSHWSLYRRKP